MSFDTCIITCICHCIIVQWYCTLISLYKILSLNWKSSIVYLFIPHYSLMSGNHWSFYCLHQFSSVQSLSRVQLFATPWIAAHQASLSITNSQSSLKLMSSKTMIPSSHLILCHPQLLLPPIPPSIKSLFQGVNPFRMRWPKRWSFSFSISPSNEHPGLISFRIDWLGLLEVQGTLKSLLQHHSSKASILRHSAFFVAQISHPYMTNGKTISLPRRTYVGKVISLLFNMLSRLVITLPPSSKWKWSRSVMSYSVTPWTVAYQAPPSMGFSRQEYWSGLPFPSPGGSSRPRDQTWVSCIPGRRFNLWATREALPSSIYGFNFVSFPYIKLAEDEKASDESMPGFLKTWLISKL